jgi:hypothetical protein
MSSKLEMPKRSVTRFFIPLIDVLTLLFCIYLVMPMVGTADGKGPEDESAALKRRIDDLEAKLSESGKAGEELAAKLRREIEDLKKARGKALADRVAVRVLEIDPKNGKLFYRELDPKTGKLMKFPINNASDARALVLEDRRIRGLGDRELYYLILAPRERSGFPTEEQEDNYRRWFEQAGALVAIDRPGGVTKGTHP